MKTKSEWKIGKKDWFVFNGKKLRNDDPGNIHFGYVGSVMFPVNILRVGGGIYQIYTKTTTWKYWWTFFDDPRDSSMILYGNKLFKSDVLKVVYNALKVFSFKLYWL